MDQTINETMEYIVYRNRINATCETLEKQSQKSFETNGRVIGKYGYVFYKEDGKLKQIVDPKLAKYIRAKAEAQGLLKTEETPETAVDPVMASNFVSEM